jgi:RNA polymerase sigma-70 factor (ECF subfamily)
MSGQEPAGQAREAGVSSLLVERCRRGDRAAWVALYRQHSRMVALFLQRLLGPTDDVEDLVQQVFCELFTSLRSFRGESSLGTWIYGICSHVAHRHVRFQVQWRRRRQAYGDWLAASGGDRTTDASCGSDARDALRRLGQALARMDLNHREVWIMREWEGLASEEVATALGIPVGTVRSRLFRARADILEATAAGDTVPASAIADLAAIRRGRDG